jgi:aspartate/methionine/tyrosine aminotransferase
MEIAPFKLERYFARHEFTARYLLSSSDCDGLAMAELLGWADSELRAMWDRLTLGYTESPGHPMLRQAIASLYDGVSADEIIAFVPEEAVFASMSCLLQPGDHVVCCFPAYQSLYEIAATLGCEVERWLAREEEGGWQFLADELEQLVRPTTRLIVCNFPHNPTGFLPSRDDFARIVAIARGCGAYLFSDEMYRYLEHHPADRLPSAVEVYERAIVLFGMSKTFGLAGLRVGWLVTHDEQLRQRLLHLKDYLTICGSAPSELLAIIALRNRERIIERHVRRIRENLDRLAELAAAHPGLIELRPTRAGSVCFPRLLTDEPALSFCERVLREAEIMIVPSEIFGYGEHHVRLGLGRESFGEALAYLSAYLRN